MRTAFEVAIGLGLGGLGAWFHLAITRWRATLALQRGAAAALLAMPVGLIGFGIVVVIAAHVSPITAWTVPLGIFAVRLAVLRSARR